MQYIKYNLILYFHSRDLSFHCFYWSLRLLNITITSWDFLNVNNNIISCSTLSGNATILHPTPQRPTVLVTPKPIFGAAIEQTEPVDFSTGTSAATRVGVIAGPLAPVTVQPLLAPADSLPLSPPPAIVPQVSQAPYPSPIRSPFSQIQSPITLQAAVPSPHPTSLPASLPSALSASLPPTSCHPVTVSIATPQPQYSQQQCPSRLLGSTVSPAQTTPSTIQVILHIYIYCCV